MTGLRWSESLNAPLSLATRGNTAVAVIEDPGVIEIHLPAEGLALQGVYAEILGADLPENVWEVTGVEDMRLICVRPGRWQIVLPRERVAALVGAIADRIAVPRMSDLTGASACFRIIGNAADEILARVCPLDLAQVGPDRARGTSIGRVRCLLVRENSSTQSWMLLAPRSYAQHVGAVLVEAARTPGRLALFEPAAVPPI